MKILLDPGHGGKDPGVVWGSTLEKDAALETALTLKYLLTQAGHTVDLTRDGDTRPEYRERTRSAGYQALVSIHYNSAKTYGLVYHQQDKRRNPGSFTLACLLASVTGLSRIWSTAQSRFGRLYIDDSAAPAVLWEVDSVDGYHDTPEYRLAKCAPVVQALEKLYGKAG